MTRPSRSLIHMLGPVVCAVWAGSLCYLSGMRGFFAMDQSIVFDGAWRILQGQIPYTDFVLPFGPFSLWIQAATFLVFGVSYKVYVLTAAAMNMGGALLAYGTFRVLASDRKWPAWVAGLITGSWLYAPMGTTYAEQTGFFVLWIAMFAVLRGLVCRGQTRLFCMALAGFALAGAILAKTNTGVLATPCLFLMPAILRKRPIRDILLDWLSLGTGLVMGLGMFWIWLVICSDPAVFQRHVLEIAGREGRKRFFENKDFHFTLCSLFTGKGNDLIRTLTVCAYVLLALGISLAVGPWRKIKRAAELRLCGCMGILWVGFQQVFSITSNNNGINEQPFIGLIFVAAVWVVRDIFSLSHGAKQAPDLSFFCKRTTFFLLAVALMFTGYMYAKGIRSMGNYNGGLGVLLALGVFRLATAKAGRQRLPSLGWAGCGALFLAIPFVIGAWGSYFRQAQDLFNFQTRYHVHGEIPMLKGLAWAEGVDEGETGRHPTWPEFVQTWKCLKEAPGRFYLWGNHTLLHAATGKGLPGYLLWIHQGLTYPRDYDVALDLRLVRQVDQPDVTYLVTEDEFRVENKRTDFPQLERLLMTKYRLEKKIGPFRLYRRTQKDIP